MTELFDKADPYVNQNAMFGVRDPAVLAKFKLSGPYQVVEFPVVLAAEAKV